MGKFVHIAALLAFSVSAGADEFTRRLSEANEFLRDGNPVAAAAIYEDLYVENPDSDIVAYNLGVARHDAAKTAQQRENADEAARQFELAQQAYDKAGSSPRADVRDAARFNKANTLVEQSQLAKAAGDAPSALKGLETAIAEYDAALETAPDLAAAKNNRAHARFLYRQLKEEQENQEQQQQQNSEEQQEGENQEQPQDSQESDDANQQPSDQNQDGGQQDEQQEGESQPQPQDGDSPDQASDERQEDGDPSAESEEEAEESPHSLQEMADANPQDGTPEEEQREEGEDTQSMAEIGEEDRPLEQNLEALLQSLADQDHRQQRDDMRQRRPGYTVPREWW